LFAKIFVSLSSFIKHDNISLSLNLNSSAISCKLLLPSILNKTLSQIVFGPDKPSIDKVSFTGEITFFGIIFEISIFSSSSGIGSYSFSLFSV